jgi:toxin ParE1/3/4
VKFEYEISRLTERDLEEIWLYTFENWSLGQADTYYGLLIKAIDGICQHPELGKPIDYVKHGHRIRRIKSHMIVYKVLEDKIYIDRILHKRMDIETRLGD